MTPEKRAELVAQHEQNITGLQSAERHLAVINARIREYETRPWWRLDLHLTAWDVPRLVASRDHLARSMEELRRQDSRMMNLLPDCPPGYRLSMGPMNGAPPGIVRCVREGKGRGVMPS